MTRVLELDEEILEHITGGTNYRTNQYVQGNGTVFSGIGLITAMGSGANGMVYTVFVMQTGRVYYDVPETAFTYANIR